MMLKELKELLSAQTSPQWPHLLLTCQSFAFHPTHALTWDAGQLVCQSLIRYLAVVSVNWPSSGRMHRAVREVRLLSQFCVNTTDSAD